jgi:CHAD domain-containing protein
VRGAAPIHILRSQATTILTALPQLRDGHVEAVHDARVASRRIREVLPLAAGWYPQPAIAELAETFRRIGKYLGRVRDADARIVLLAYLGMRVTPASASLLELGRQQDQNRLRLVRKLIKRFERADVERVLRLIASRPARAHRPWARNASRWPDQLRRAITERAREARESVHHGTGVYFPNRSHGTRIALKKLRYALEIACAAGAGPDTRESLQYLKKTQEVLGDLHDRQVLADDLLATTTPDVEIDPSQIRLVTQYIAAESRDLHARFLRRRSQVLNICDRFEQVRGRRGLPVARAATALVISSAFYLWRRTRASERPPPEPAVSVRVPISERSMAAR